jgi:Fe-S cluster assembly iron-binding protein IscA
MLSLTTSAKVKLKENLDEVRIDESTFIRIAPSQSNPQEIGFQIDQLKKGDQLIEDDMGKGLLLVGEDIASILDDMVLDYVDSPSGMGFNLSRA